MVFSSVTFLFYFLPLFLALYLLFARFRSLVIVVASVLFYAWGEPRYVLLLAFVTVLNWGVGLVLQRPGPGRVVLALGVAANLSLLVWFKYLGFIVSQADGLLLAAGLPAVGIPAVSLPLGISFFTFQGVSYLIDIHRGDIKAQPSLLKFAMYKTMFPQLIAGPIVRYRDIAEEIDDRSVSFARWRRGVEVFVVGLAQKVIIANTVALPADQIFGLPAAQLATAAAWLGAVCYMIQIVFDFSGYTNMAIGLGHLMGFTLPRNFDRPYTAQSVTEFWRRWHITLSRWFRDYLYIPLGGNRRGGVQTYANLLTVFFLCGIWHGAKWTFVAWGLYHGFFLVIERAASSSWRVWRPLRHLYLLLTVLVGWVLFRADSLREAVTMLQAMAGLGSAVPGAPLAWRFASSSVVAAMLAAALLTAAPPLATWRTAVARIVPAAIRRPGAFRSLPGTALLGVVEPAAILCLFVLAVSVLSAGTHNPFIYFRF